MIYLELFWGFLKVGLFSFGGAYAAIPLIRDVVMSYGWIDEEMMTYMIAVSESTPGPIMINLATYIGTERAGILGAAVATFAVVLPSFFIILLLTALLSKVTENKYVQAVLAGVKPCMIGIILATGFFMIVQNVLGAPGIGSLWKNPGEVISFTDLKALILTLLLGGIYWGVRKIRQKGISPIMLIGIAAVMGLVVYGF